MNETMRTSIYVAVAAVSIIGARFSIPSVAKSPAEFRQLGTEFYPDFKDAGAAKSLTVITYNAETAKSKVFGVEQGPDGVWRVPGRHHGYPVDGKDRLAKTATSVIGLKRDQLAGQRKKQHAEFGVIDPRSEADDFKGIGNRLTLKDGKDGNVLADLIIGKEVKGRQGFFYVRKADEEQTYAAKVSIDVSTKFTDWIEADLLKLDASKLRTVIVDKRSIDITEKGVSFGEQEANKLSRASSTDKWKLDGLDEATEEVNEDEVRKLVQALDDLKIVGVRPKGERLKKQLQKEVELSPDDRMAFEMQEMGFFFKQTGPRTVKMISQEGDVTATTDQGVEYELHFGSVFTGTEEEIEAGFIKSNDDKGEGEKKDGEKNDAGDDSKKIKGRYFFVQTRFDVEGLGPKPEAPVKPEAPADDVKPEAANLDTPADAGAAENALDKVDPKKAYEAALAKFESDSKKYESDVKAYADKVTAGEKLAKELNRRFSDWYYAISGDSFENLRQGRKTLVKAKSATEKPADSQF